MKTTIVTVVLDLLSILLVFLPWIVLQLVGSPYRRGFFCNDESIKYPLRHNTVTNAALTSTAIILPFLILPIHVIGATTLFRVFKEAIFVIVEAIHCMGDSNSSALSYPNSHNSNKFPWRKYVRIVYSIYLMFLFGLAIQQTLTNIGKYSIGRLRPHFLAACRPDLSLLNCTSSVINEPGNVLYSYVMIDDDVCDQPNKRTLMDARLSFPSGHSSMSTYVAVFLSLYLQARFTWKGSRLLRHFLQAGLCYLAFFVCLSRVSDYKHHWSDVLFGAIIGISVASLTCIHIANKYIKQVMKSSSFNVQENGTRSDADVTGHLANV